MPKRPEQNKAIQEKRRQAIKDKGLRLFAVNGFDNVSIDDICQAAKCAHGLFYHYYESKEDLFDELLKEMPNDLFPYEEARTELGFSGLKLLLVQITKALNAKPSTVVAYLLLHITFQDQEDLQKPTYKKRFLFYLLAKEKIKEGQKEGIIISGDPEEILNALIGLLRDQLITKLAKQKKGYKYLSEDVLELLLQKSRKI